MAPKVIHKSVVGTPTYTLSTTYTKSVCVREFVYVRIPKYTYTRARKNHE